MYAAEGALHPGQGFVAVHGGRVVHDLEAEAGVHDIDVIVAASASIALVLRAKARLVSVMVRSKCLRILCLSITPPTASAMSGGATQRLALARGGQSDTREIAFGGRQQFLALAGALGGKIAIAANDQTLAGKSGW